MLISDAVWLRARRIGVLSLSYGDIVEATENHHVKSMNATQRDSGGSPAPPPEDAFGKLPSCSEK